MLSLGVKLTHTRQMRWLYVMYMATLTPPSTNARTHSTLTGKMSQADISKAQEKTTQYIKDHPDVY